MPVQKIMDHTGHSEKVFDRADVVSVEEAEKRFAELTGRGFKAIAQGADGDAGTILKAFDPNVESTLFIPQLQGG